jgi:hypothetical protein
MRFCACLFLLISFYIFRASAQKDSSFKVLAFYTAKNDLAHISFVQEANEWFAARAKENHFRYDTTSNWNKLNNDTLPGYRVILFLDTRPEVTGQRQAFEHYMKNGGAWMGFHFAGFALTPSAYPQNWDWYHNEFLGSGQYKGNTWRPTPAILKKENTDHPVTKGLPFTFLSAPNEWYSWEKDLRLNRAIEILYSIDTSSFPLGTGPKQHEIWHSGYYPVIWTNKNYRMLYINMGHNDMDYESGSNKTLSLQTGNIIQNKLLLNGLLWLLHRPAGQE